MFVSLFKENSDCEMSSIPRRVVRSWYSYPWESLNHYKVISLLKKIIKTKYDLATVPFHNEMKKEAEIAIKYRLRNPRSYVAHTPDIVIRTGDKPEDRILIEYINSEGKNDRQFLFDLRGMVALSRLMKARCFIVAIRHSIYLKYGFTSLPVLSYVVIMSLKSMLYALDNGDLDYLCDEDIRKTRIYKY